MPKLKTHKGAKDRFKITGTGKIMRTIGPKTHLRVHKTKRTRRQFDKMTELSPADRKRISRLIPNGVK
ncbi:MAG: 50S ribosomal protein L35 [Dehalococcoidales bacterium]|jgi:large subunit ribosomal protein L35